MSGHSLPQNWLKETRLRLKPSAGVIKKRLIMLTTRDQRTRFKQQVEKGLQDVLTSLTMKHCVNEDLGLGLGIDLLRLRIINADGQIFPNSFI